MLKNKSHIIPIMKTKKIKKIYIKHMTKIINIDNLMAYVKTIKYSKYL